jgi:integrase
MMLTRYCAPIAKLRVDEVDTAVVLKVLKPSWARAPAVGLRLRGYIENVLAAAQALGHIHEDKANPARWKGHLELLLPRKPEGRHFAALDYRRAPEFVLDLRYKRFNDDGSLCLAAHALEFLALTATRANETLGCQWREIDIEGRLWAIPKERTKSGRMFEVPLSDAVIVILKEMRAIRDGDNPFVFPGRFNRRPMDSKVFERLVKGESETTRGLRSTFRDWAGNETPTPRDVAEMALAHKIGSATEQAYRRSDALEKRRALMQQWGAYLTAPAAEVIRLSSRARRRA